MKRDEAQHGGIRDFAKTLVTATVFGFVTFAAGRRQVDRSVRCSSYNSEECTVRVVPGTLSPVREARARPFSSPITMAKRSRRARVLQAGVQHEHGHETSGHSPDRGYASSSRGTDASSAPPPARGCACRKRARRHASKGPRRGVPRRMTREPRGRQQGGVWSLPEQLYLPWCAT